MLNEINNNLLLLLQKIIFKKLTNCAIKSAEQKDEILKIMRSLKNYKILAKKFKAKVNKKFTDVVSENENKIKIIILKQLIIHIKF